MSHDGGMNITNWRRAIRVLKGEVEPDEHPIIQPTPDLTFWWNSDEGAAARELLLADDGAISLGGTEAVQGMATSWFFSGNGFYSVHGPAGESAAYSKQEPKIDGMTITEVEKRLVGSDLYDQQVNSSHDIVDYLRAELNTIAEQIHEDALDLQRAEQETAAKGIPFFRHTNQTPYDGKPKFFDAAH